MHLPAASVAIFAVLLLSTCLPGAPLPPPDNGSPPSDDGSPSPTDRISLATWNIRILSDGSRDDAELAVIASILDRYDLIAVQEVRDTVVLDRLLALLPASAFAYLASPEVGTTQTELYAYFYRPELVTPLGTAYVYNDGSDKFIREPFIAHFRAGLFDFTLVTIHVIFGDSISDRRAEVALLDDVLAHLDENNAGENDVILLGDFNLPADDQAWEILTHTGLVAPTVMTTISDTSSYDNIWVSSTATGELDSLLEIYRFDEGLYANDDAAASLAVSDHRPLAALFTTSGPDDDSGGNYSDIGANDTLPGGGGGTPVGTTGDVRIVSVTAHPTDDEQVTIRNYSGYPVDISDWTLGDLNDPDAYEFPNGTMLAAGESRTYPRSTLGFGINNSAETLYLKDVGGGIIDTWTN